MANTDFLGWISSVKKRDITKIKRSVKLAKVTHMTSLVGRLKIPTVTNWIRDHLQNTEDKLVLFAHHVAVCEAYHKSDRTSVLVNGSVSARNRDLAKEKFNTDPRCKLFVGNMQAAGTGLSLKAPDLAFAELAWTRGAHDQAAARIHGIGRGVENKTSREWWLIAKGTIEEDICEILQKKGSIADAIVDGGKTSDSLDILDTLLEKLGKTKRRFK